MSRRQAKGKLHCRLRSVRSESVKLRGGTPQGACPGTPHTRPVSSPRRSESVQLRGNSAQVSLPRRSESVQLRGDSTGHAPRCRSVRKAFACVARVCRGELHRSRAQVSPSQRVSRACEGRRGARVCCAVKPSRGCEGRGGPGRCRAVKLRGNSTRPGRAGVSRRQAKGELHRAGARGCRAGVRAGARGCVAPSS